MRGSTNGFWKWQVVSFFLVAGGFMGSCVVDGLDGFSSFDGYD